MRACLLTGQAAACPSDGPVRDPSTCVQLIVLPSAALVRRSRGPSSSSAARDSPPPHLLKALADGYYSSSQSWSLAVQEERRPQWMCQHTPSYWFLLVPTGPVPLLLQFVSQWSTFFLYCVFLSKYSLNIPLTNLRHGYRWVLVAHHPVVGCFGWVRAVSPWWCVYVGFFFFLCRGGQAFGPAGSAVTIVSHERDDAGRGSGQLEEGVLEKLLGCGSLQGLPHQHQIQEGPQHRGHLEKWGSAFNLFGQPNKILTQKIQQRHRNQQIRRFFVRYLVWLF